MQSNKVRGGGCSSSDYFGVSFLEKNTFVSSGLDCKGIFQFYNLFCTKLLKGLKLLFFFLLFIR